MIVVRSAKTLKRPGRRQVSAHALLVMQLRALGVAVETEHRFDPERKWRADIYLRPHILIEVDGALYSQGRHVRGAGAEADMEKLNRASELGYRIFRYSTGMVKSGAAITQLRRVLGA